MPKDLPGVIVAPGDIEEFVDGIYGANREKNKAAYRRIAGVVAVAAAATYASSKKKKKKRR